jgi:pimeloyl-ACP methyl ester carboxylesterase
MAHRQKDGSILNEFALELDGITLRGMRRPGAGRRCLALHGWLDNAGTFSRLLPHLPEWDIVALDMPGHGHSDWIPTPGFYHFIDGVNWVVRVAQSLQVPLTLLGHSMGGALAGLAGAVLQNQVEAVFMLDSLGPLTNPAEEALALFQRSLASAKPFRRRYYSTREEALARIAQQGHSAGAAEALVQRSLVWDGNGWYFRYDPRLKAVSRARLTEAQIQNFLQALRCPVQVQSFSDGLLPKFDPTAERLAALPRGELVELAGGHHLHLEDPASVAHHILEFEDRHLGQRSA